MNRICAQCLYANLSDCSVQADVLVREEPDEEDDEGDGEEDDEDEDTDDGYSE